MSFTNDVVANIRYQLQEMRVDDDPTMPELTIHVKRSDKNGRILEVRVIRASTHGPAPAGVLARESLDNSMLRP